MILSKDEQLSVWDFSVKLSKSKMIPAIFQGKCEDIFVSILYGREFGISPIMALHSLCVIQGQVTMKVQTMNAIVRAKCPEAIIDIKQDHTKKEVVVIAKRNPKDAEYVSTWNMTRAKEMGLASKNNWIVQPMNMLKARALSEALRTVFADVLCGLYSEEEMQDLPPVRNEAQPMAITTGKEDLENDFPIPVEDKTYGPLYKVQNGKFRDLRFYEIDMIELDEYREELRARSKKKTWEVSLLAAIDDYFSNYEIYREDIARMRDEQE